MDITVESVMTKDVDNKTCGSRLVGCLIIGYKLEILEFERNFFELD